MNAKNLGRLREVELREAWSSESSEFTPWLAQPDNLKLLGDTIGLNLELVSTEKEVGKFRADILCKDAATDHWVLIENQLEETDHTHLGQLLTYAAGLDAVTIVWVAKEFTDAHRAAIDWLNEKTEEGINFFALEVELWQIGGSPFAPKFNIVSQPNEYTRSVADSARDPEIIQRRWDYWSAFVKVADLSTILTGALSPCRQPNLNLPTRWRDFKLAVNIAGHPVRVGGYIMCRGENGGHNYRQLLAKKADLEKKFDMKLSWSDGTDENKGWIGFTLEGCDGSKTEDWPRQHKLLASMAVGFYKAFDPFIQELDASNV